MWQQLFIMVLQRFPWENLILRPRNETDRLEKLARLLNNTPGAEAQTPAPPRGVPKTEPQSLSGASWLPTMEETIEELRHRLGKELYRMELDLISGGRIAGRPCDCLGKKHTLGLEATAEELLRGALNTSRFVCNHVPKSNFMGSI